MQEVRVCSNKAIAERSREKLMYNCSSTVSGNNNSIPGIKFVWSRVHF